MKDINSFIKEGLKITSKTKVNQQIKFSDEELRDDYKEVAGATTKAEKQKIANKYGIQSNKIREIQLVILDHLRDNRHDKKEYDVADFAYFVAYGQSEKYDKYKEYLEKEPIEFVEYVLKQYQDSVKNIKYPRSLNDKYKFKRIDQLTKFLHENT